MKDLINDYNQARNIAESLLGHCYSKQVCDILDRGWAISSDFENGIGHNGVLITGINPSFDDVIDAPGACRYSYSSAISNINQSKRNKEKFWWIKHQYWIRAKQIFGEPGEITSNIGFIDLFPIRCKNQKDFSSFDKDDSKLLLKSNLLKVTQQAIEDLSPKIIIHANRTSGFYWGLDQRAPWMGYITESVLETKEEIPREIRELCSDIDIRIIKGVCQDDRCIWEGPSRLVENKTYLVLYRQLGYQYIKNPGQDRNVFQRLFQILDV